MNYDKEKEYKKINTMCRKAGIGEIHFHELNANQKKKIVDLFLYDILFIPKSNTMMMCFLGDYYFIKHKFEMMKKFWGMACERGDVNAMLNLGWFYRYQQKSPELMKHYYELASNLGDTMAMCELCDYIANEENDPELAKRYCLQASGLGDHHGTELLHELFNENVLDHCNNDHNQ